ncbi:hypothetical protein HB847_07630 [Listeria booriae]|uniref:HpcH/HpaI aldolase/citrate lyase domain-containing protein n=1 Tax=Listeria booriae TaxID=1552123 RepID=A0A841XYE0_9LIST|nr:isocitrate lyase/phosphoenolpyruvate mutase family protein [Listeria booriae]MBC1372241.1 hypothetical protein [Listeria booriae]
MNTYNGFYDAHFQEEALILYNCWDVASAQAIEKAGADGIFIPGLTDLDLIQAFAEHSSLPVNIMINDDPNRYTNLKIARLSYGPASFLNAQKQLEKIAHPILKGRKNR